MKRFVTLGLVLTIVLTAIVSSANNIAKAQSAGLVSSIINRMERNRRSLRSLRASISMEKWNAQLGDTDRYTGSLIYMPSGSRGANVRVEWTSPQREILAVLNGQYTLFRPRLNMAYVGTANSSSAKVSGVLGFGLNVSSQQLKTKFDYEDLGEETLWGGVRTTHLKFVPKGQASFKYAEVWVDSDGMPVQTKVVEKNDDATTVRLTDVQRNAQVSPDEFRVQLDSSVKKVRS
jgi:outer membrane lipoprotein-sorting protein